MIVLFSIIALCLMSLYTASLIIVYLVIGDFFNALTQIEIIKIQLDIHVTFNYNERSMCVCGGVNKHNNKGCFIHLNNRWKNKTQKTIK